MMKSETMQQDASCSLRVSKMRARLVAVALHRL
jgi:hypothetical protein